MCDSFTIDERSKFNFIQNQSKVGEELERMQPTLFSYVTRQMTRPSGGDLQEAETVAVLLSAVARDLFRSDITWGKVSFH